MTKIYIVIIEDRHTDVVVLAYKNKEEAIEAGKKMAKDYCGREEDYEEHQIEGWLFHAKYSCEGDSVTVQEIDLL